MTAATIGAEFAVVHIVGAMTIGAGIANTLHRNQRAPVTVVAGNIYMGTIQAEARLRVVIE